MIGYLAIALIFCVVLLIYWRLSRNYKIGDQLILELKGLAEHGKIVKKRINVKVYDTDTAYTSTVNLNTYQFEEGILFFQGKDDIGSSITWLYFDADNKNFIKNCQSRGEIQKIEENETGLIYTVRQTTNLLPLYFGTTTLRYEIFK